MLDITYDASVDAAYISLHERGDGAYNHSVPMDDFVKKEFYKKCPFYALDFDKDNRLIGIEILDASKHLPKELIEYTLMIQKMKAEPRDLAPGC